MSIRSAWLLCAIVLFGAYGALAIMTPSPTDPPEISITLPAPDLATQLAALSGVWEPALGDDATTRVVVERIDETRATILLIGRNHPPGYPNGGWERVRARVLRDGAIEWGYPARFTLRIAENGAALEGLNERNEVSARTTLKKVGAIVSLSGPTPQATLTRAVYQPGEGPGR